MTKALEITDQPTWTATGNLDGDPLPMDHPPPLAGPVTGPSAWRGDEMRERNDWVHVLSAEQQAELEVATASVRGRDIAKIERSDFVLPGFGPVLDTLRREVVRGRGFVLLRGLPIEGRSFAEIAAMYWGVGTYLGRARAQNTRGHLLGHVIDITDRFDDTSDRGYLSARHLHFHCDSVDVVALLCIRKARRGGESSIVSSHTIHDEMWRRRPDLAIALYGPVPRDRRDEIPDGRGPWYELPVFNHAEGRLAVNFLREHINMSQRHVTARRIDPVLEEALDMVYTLAREPALHLTMAFEPGDVQILHNHQVLHDRTAYEDWPEYDRRRYLLRLWLSPPDGITLPQAFAGRYGSVAVGDRGGIDVPGMRPQVPLSAY